MTLAQSISVTTQDPNHEIIYPQGEYWSHGPPLESNLHLTQIILLIKSLEWLWQDKDDYFAAGNLTIYYSRNQKKSEEFRGPDFFVVLGTTRNPNRRSWVVWEEEGKYPNLIIEILSSSTAKTDRGEKKQIYQDIFRTPDYFWFDPESLEFAGFTLISSEYQPIQPNDQGWLWSEQLGLYLGIYEGQLRYFQEDGMIVSTPEEASKQAENRAIQAEGRAMQAENRAMQAEDRAMQAEDRAIEERQQKELALQEIEQLKARLRELGANSDGMV